MDERERQVEPAPHAAGVAADLAIGCVGEPDALDQLVAAAKRLGLRDPVHARLQAHVLAGREELVERRLLEGDADRVADLGALLDDVVAGDLAVPAVGGSSVVSMWTVVDLPAPFGPRKP